MRKFNVSVKYNNAKYNLQNHSIAWSLLISLFHFNWQLSCEGKNVEFIEMLNTTKIIMNRVYDYVNDSSYNKTYTVLGELLKILLEIDPN